MLTDQLTLFENNDYCSNLELHSDIYAHAYYIIAYVFERY